MGPTDEQLAELFPGRSTPDGFVAGCSMASALSPIHHRARVSSAGSCGETVSSESTDQPGKRPCSSGVICPYPPSTSCLQH